MTVVLVSAFLGMLRAIGHKSQAFQAAAHMWMGFLVTMWWYGGPTGGFYLWMILILSVVEVVCFLIYREPSTPRWMRRTGEHA